MKSVYSFTLILLFAYIRLTTSVELTFELPDNAQQCFYEDIKEGEKFRMEFQVVTGGNYDVDVRMEGPDSSVLYKGTKKQFDNYNGVASRTGVYKTCFSNEFSTFSHKLIYFEFQVGEEQPLPGLSDHLTAMTLMEASSAKIHENLNTVVDYQTAHRLRETQGRKRAEDLNSRVLFWSLGETVLIITIGIFQVIILKNFFTDKKTTITT